MSLLLGRGNPSEQRVASIQALPLCVQHMAGSQTRLRILRGMDEVQGGRKRGLGKGYHPGSTIERQKGHSSTGAMTRDKAADSP